jgi:hypothetical protein
MSTDGEGPGAGDGADDWLYPNRSGGDRPLVTLSRRRMLAASVTVGAGSLAGCGSGPGDTSTTAATATDGSTLSETATATATSSPSPEPAETADTVYVFNTGDRTASLIDVDSDAVVATVPLGYTSSFPSNQYTPGLTDASGDPLWLNVGRGVRAVAVGSLSDLAAVETGSGANWQELTPDGRHLVVSAREPAHTNYRIDADPASDSFGTVTGELDRTDEGGRGDNDGPGPCDVTVHPDGAYAYVPDLFGDTLTVLDIDAFEIVTQVDVESVGDAAAAPWMGTAAPDGDTLLVEHNEGAAGTESIWDTSDPAAPEELVRLTNDDGLGRRPLTSEIGPDSETGYVFTPGSNSVTLVDIPDQSVASQFDLGGSAFAGTWGPNHEKLYVPVRSADEVAVVDHGRGEIATTVPVGARPYGATAATVRPANPPTEGTPADASLGSVLGSGTSYCIGECACGHRL